MKSSKRKGARRIGLIALSWSAVLAVLAISVEVPAAELPQQYERRASLSISYRGIAGARWGASVERVERAAGVAFDCSEGLLPGRCLCPPAIPEVKTLFVFDAKPPKSARLQAVISADSSARTPRGVAIGSTRRTAEKAYPAATYKANAPLTGGLSSYLLSRHHGHALVLVLDNGRVGSIMAFARGGFESITAEQCA
jgi:hypothetical protein